MMRTHAAVNPKVVTVHRGARDNYQVARALHEGGMLDVLVTDLYWPADSGWAKASERVLPGRVTNLLARRNAPRLPAGSVTQMPGPGLSSLMIANSRSLPFTWKRDATRWCDRELGKRAGKIASQRGSALLSYSYYARSAFFNYTGSLPKILFQLHPHPASVRQILQNELSLHPECAGTLNREWELALPEPEFQELVQEAAIADFWLVASQFSKQTLIAAGAPPERITVIPYGTDLAGFQPRHRSAPTGRKLRLLFVGTLCQRKGLTYLLQAMKLLPMDQVELTLCGRAVDDLNWIRNSGVPVNIRESVSAEELREQYGRADVFVFPSLAEGFGHVLLEAMASGLPIISTERTAAPDLIEDGVHGFIADAGNAEALATAISDLLRHPSKVPAMSRAARERAELFTWSRFRERIASCVRDILTPPNDEQTVSPREAACLNS